MANFILKHDLLTKIKEPELTILTEDTVNPDEELNTSIQAAESELKAHIIHRHDMDVVMPPVYYFAPVSPLYSLDDIVVVYTNEEWDVIVSYEVGDVTYILKTNKVYRCNSPFNTGINPALETVWDYIGDRLVFYKSLEDNNISDPTRVLSWDQLPEDPRDALLKRMLIDLTLYDLHARIKPRQIPEHRVQLRDDAIKLLRDAADPRKNITLDLPLIDHGDKSGVDLTYGGNDKLSHSY